MPNELDAETQSYLNGLRTGDNRIIIPGGEADPARADKIQLYSKGEEGRRGAPLTPAAQQQYTSEIESFVEQNEPTKAEELAKYLIRFEDATLSDRAYSAAMEGAFGMTVGGAFGAITGAVTGAAFPSVGGEERGSQAGIGLAEMFASKLPKVGTPVRMLLNATASATGAQIGSSGEGGLDTGSMLGAMGAGAGTGALQGFAAGRAARDRTISPALETAQKVSGEEVGGFGPARDIVEPGGFLETLRNLQSVAQPGKEAITKRVQTMNKIGFGALDSLGLLGEVPATKGRNPGFKDTLQTLANEEFGRVKTRLDGIAEGIAAQAKADPKSTKGRFKVRVDAEDGRILLEGDEARGAVIEREIEPRSMLKAKQMIDAFVEDPVKNYTQLLDPKNLDAVEASIGLMDDPTRSKFQKMVASRSFVGPSLEFTEQRAQGLDLNEFISGRNGQAAGQAADSGQPIGFNADMFVQSFRGMDDELKRTIFSEKQLEGLQALATVASRADIGFGDSEVQSAARYAFNKGVFSSGNVAAGGSGRKVAGAGLSLVGGMATAVGFGTLLSAVVDNPNLTKHYVAIAKADNVATANRAWTHLTRALLQSGKFVGIVDENGQVEVNELGFVQ